jgi:uncharacterized protein (DUF427 family)
VRFPPVSVEPTERRIRVRLGGRVVADSGRALLLIEYGPGRLPTYYLPPEDVTAGVLTGETSRDGARAWAVQAGGVRRDGAAWEHPAPTGDLAALAGLVTFD